MLTAENEKGQKVIAVETEKTDGPFHCPECQKETVLHKGKIKVHHFAHKPPVSCECGKGESEEHRQCKYEIYSELKKDGRFDCELEKPLGKVRPDIWLLSKATGNQCAIEVQISVLTMDKIIYRTEQYNKLGVYVLWLSPYSEALDEDVYAPKSWEKWVHATYFGRVYYWQKELTVVPVHFGEHQKYIDESTWYETGGHEMSAGGYFKSMKRTKTISKGDPVEITKAFKPVQRDAWRGGDIVIPKCRILSDTQSPWWKTKSKPSQPYRPVLVTENGRKAPAFRHGDG